MGMFDYIDYECECPVCGAAVLGFQSKSGPCALSILAPAEVANFYSHCGPCGLWIAFDRIVQPTENFTMTWKDANQMTMGTKDVDLTAEER